VSIAVVQRQRATDLVGRQRCIDFILPGDPVSARQHLSDKGLAVFAFAIYHGLESGSRITQVVRDDSAGHRADEEAIHELQQLGLVRIEDHQIRFTEGGETMLDAIVAAMRGAAAGAK
jgi:ribosomal protein S19E (S16A)